MNHAGFFAVSIPNQIVDGASFRGLGYKCAQDIGAESFRTGFHVFSFRKILSRAAVRLGFVPSLLWWGKLDLRNLVLFPLLGFMLKFFDGGRVMPPLRSV